MHTPEDIKTLCSMSARYHSHRYRFLTFMWGAMWLLATIGGVLFVSDRYDELYRMLGFAMVIVTLQAGFCIQRVRNVHHKLYKKFTIFSGKVTSTADVSGEMLRRWNLRLQRLYAQESPVAYKALIALARNEVVIRNGHPEEATAMFWYHHWFKNCYTFPRYGLKEKMKGQEKSNKAHNSDSQKS